MSYIRTYERIFHYVKGVQCSTVWYFPVTMDYAIMESLLRTLLGLHVVLNRLPQWNKYPLPDLHSGIPFTRVEYPLPCLYSGYWVPLPGLHSGTGLHSGYRVPLPDLHTLPGLHSGYRIQWNTLYQVCTVGTGSLYHGIQFTSLHTGLHSKTLTLT